MDAILIPSLGRITTIQSDWGTTIKGNYKNLEITKKANDMITISGSIQKFYGTTANLDFDENKKAILSLCDTFSFSPEEAQVKRIDIAKNISTQFEPKSYYPFLGSHQFLMRNYYKNSLYYGNKSRSRTLAFYDKAKEQNLKGNILRYEYRDFRPDMTFKKIVSLADLLKEETYNLLVSNWQSNYRTIQKVKNLLPMESIKNPKQFFEYLMALGQLGLGNDYVNNQLRIAQRAGFLNKQHAKRIRDKMNRLSNSQLFSQNSLVDELDSKIGQL
jgi:hypothetical protein